jgi:cell division protein FtsB
MNNKLVIRILIAVVFLGASSFIVFNENGLLKFLKIRKELKQMDSEIKKAEEKLFMLEQEIDSLKTSKIKLERVAREKFHMLRKTEKVFRIEEK